MKVLRQNSGIDMSKDKFDASFTDQFKIRGD